MKPLIDPGKALEEIRTQIHDTDYRNRNSIDDDGSRVVPAGRQPARAFDLKTEYAKADNVATRDAYGAALVKIGAEDPEVVVLDGDVKNSSRTRGYFDAFPDRAVERYIAEQNMVGIALGLQAKGKHPFLATFAAFLTRGPRPVRMAAYSRARLSVAGSHTGVSIGEDGPSQMGLEDLGMMRSIYGNVVLSPSDAVSTEKLLGQTAGHNGVSYVRTIRGKTPVLYENGESFTVGGSKVLRRSDSDVG